MMAHRGAARPVFRRWHALGRGSTRASRRDRIDPERADQLGTLHSTTGCLDRNFTCISALNETVGRPDKHEAIESIRVLPIPTVEQLIAEGEITDGPTLALFLRARLRGYGSETSLEQRLDAWSNGARSMMTLVADDSDSFDPRRCRRTQ
jgi:hypothetical protein